MAKKKIDLSGVKEFLFNHGEKVALGVCGFLAIVLGGLKLLDAAGAGVDESGKPWEIGFKDAQRKMSLEMASQGAAPFDATSIDPKFFVWDPIESGYVQSPYAQVPENGDFKRRNPAPLNILDDPKSMRLDYIRGMVFVHDFNKAERTVKGVVPAAGAAPRQPKGGGAATAVVEDRLKAGRAQTFVVVHAVFPMKKQVEEFRNALKFATQKDLFDQPREDIPQIKGINVVRYELTKIGGAEVGKEPEVIVAYDPASKRLQMQPALEKLLREAMYDETNLPVFEPYLYEGLAMPLPALAYGRYPKFQFPGWQLAWADGDEPEKKVVMDRPPPGKKDGDPFTIPGPGGKKDREKTKNPNPNPQPPPIAANNAEDLDLVTIKDDKLRDVDPILSNRLFGDPDNTDKKIDQDFNVFHVLGQLTPKVVDNAKSGIKPPFGGPGKQNPLDGTKYFAAWDVDPPKMKELPPAPKDKDAPPQVVYPPWERDALVRFIDADVKPGKTYFYAIQVRVANPNFGKKADKVAFEDLTRIKELPLDNKTSWVTTPSITIPPDYFLYALDQYQIDEWSGGKKNEAKLPKDATTFQVHQWVAEKRDQEKPDRDPYLIGDFVVVERQVVRKGERIGATETVLFPFWRPIREAFLLPRTQADPKKKIPATMGALITLKGEDAPILVDFTGGKRMKPNAPAVVEEETAVDALILSFDAGGKQRLRVQNSRDDAAAMQPLAQVGFGRPDDPPLQAISRQERWQMTYRRIQDLLQAAPPLKK